MFGTPRILYEIKYALTQYVKRIKKNKLPARHKTRSPLIFIVQVPVKPQPIFCNATLRAAQTGTDDGFAGASLLRENSLATDRQGIFRWSVDEPLSKHTSQNSAT